MALFIRQNDDRSKLQERLAAELQERAKQRAALQDSPDGVSDSAYVKNTHETGKWGWVWLVIGLAACAAIVWFAFFQ